MKYSYLIASMVTLGACGQAPSLDVVTVPGSQQVNTVPGPERIVEVQVPIYPTPEAPVQCEVFTNRATLPAVHEVKGNMTIGLNKISLGEVADENVPFPAFVGTEAETVTKNFALRCSFVYEVKNAGSHVFKLNSDDGSQLFINGSRVINNSGTHGMVIKSVSVNLPVGNHEMRVVYQQGNGPKGLYVTVQAPAVTQPVELY